MNLLGSDQAHIGLEEDSDSSDLDDTSTVGGNCQRRLSRGPDTGANGRALAVCSQSVVHLTHRQSRRLVAIPLCLV